MFAIYHTFCNESINVDTKTFSEIDQNIDKVCSKVSRVISGIIDMLEIM